MDKVNSDLSNLQATSANIDLANLSTAGIDVIKSYAGGTVSKDVEELKSQVGDISAILDNINGEVV